MRYIVEEKQAKRRQQSQEMNVINMGLLLKLFADQNQKMSFTSQICMKLVDHYDVVCFGVVATKMSVLCSLVVSNKVVHVPYRDKIRSSDDLFCYIIL